MLQALADILIAAEADKILLSPSSSYSGMIMLFAQTDQLMLVTDRKDVGQAGTDADPHKEFTPVAKHCHRFMSRCASSPRRRVCPFMTQVANRWRSYQLGS